MMEFIRNWEKKLSPKRFNESWIPYVKISVHVRISDIDIYMNVTSYHLDALKPLHSIGKCL